MPELATLPFQQMRGQMLGAHPGHVKANDILPVVVVEVRQDQVPSLFGLGQVGSGEEIAPQWREETHPLVRPRPEKGAIHALLQPGAHRSARPAAEHRLDLLLDRRRRKAQGFIQ